MFRISCLFLHSDSLFKNGQDSLDILEIDLFHTFVKRAISFQQFTLFGVVFYSGQFFLAALVLNDLVTLTKVKFDARPCKYIL